MNYQKILSLILLMVGAGAGARNIIYRDDIYAHQASSELVSLVDEVAQLVDYTGDYELIEPNKAGMMINPWNRMIASGVNQQTANNFMVINADWFKNLSPDEQKFLIARCLVKFEQDFKPSLLFKATPFLFGILMWLMIFVFWLLINRTSLRSKNKWLKIFIAWLIATILNVTIFVRIQQKFLDYLTLKKELKINEMVLSKLPNKQAAINALECLDSVIKEGLKNGEQAYKAHENSFANFANELKKSN